MSIRGYLSTGQTGCHDTHGHPIPCRGTGQDAEHAAGAPWPSPRFSTRLDLVEDRLTGLTWCRDANPAGFPLTWQESLDFVAGLNATGWLGCSDWRLPNRGELRSLVSAQTRRPALPDGHPFTGVFPSWYWTSTSVAGTPSHAWTLNLDGARTFFGGKDQSFLVWPVCGNSPVLPRTGQAGCFAGDGSPRGCPGTGEDGEHQAGAPWPRPRLVPVAEGVEDRLTGLVWHPDTDAGQGPLCWAEALAAVASLGEGWRLPNINELDSLVDCARSGPALLTLLPAGRLGAAYWSSTTSMFEPDWAWALYSLHGGVGVGQKRGRHFHAWAVKG